MSAIMWVGSQKPSSWRQHSTSTVKQMPTMCFFFLRSFTFIYPVWILNSSYSIPRPCPINPAGLQIKCEKTLKWIRWLDTDTRSLSAFENCGIFFLDIFDDTPGVPMQLVGATWCNCRRSRTPWSLMPNSQVAAQAVLTQLLQPLCRSKFLKIVLIVCLDVRWCCGFIMVYLVTAEVLMCCWILTIWFLRIWSESMIFNDQSAEGSNLINLLLSSPLVCCTFGWPALCFQVPCRVLEHVIHLEISMDGAISMDFL